MPVLGSTSKPCSNRLASSADRIQGIKFQDSDCTPKLAQLETNVITFGGPSDDLVAYFINHLKKNLIGALTRFLKIHDCDSYKKYYYKIINM